MAKFKDELILVDKVSKPLKNINKNTEKTEQSTKKLEKRYKGIVAPIRNLEASLFKLDRRLARVQEQMEKTAKKTEHIKKLGDSIKGFGNKLTLGVTLPIMALGAATVKAAADMETMQTQLSTMLGSTEKGAAMFNKIQKMAAKTPFDASDLMEVTNVMLSFGQAENKVLPLMQQLGDISGGNKDKFKSLALAFSQASSVGKLQGQDWLQMVNAGFNPLEAISKRTGKSIAVLKDEMSKGKISIAMVEQAMKDVTSEGGRFFNMMEKQSRTAVGQWSTFQGQLNLLLADFGRIILPYAIKGLQKLSKLLEKFNALSEGQKKTIIIMGLMAASIGPIVSGVGSLITAVAGLTTGIRILLPLLTAVSSNPFILFLMGVAAATWAVIKAIEILIKKIIQLKGQKISGLNIENSDNLAYLSNQKQEMGAKEFNKKYDRKTRKAVEQYEKNIDNSQTINNFYNGNTNNSIGFTPIAGAALST